MWLLLIPNSHLYTIPSFKDLKSHVDFPMEMGLEIYAWMLTEVISLRTALLWDRKISDLTEESCIVD